MSSNAMLQELRIFHIGPTVTVFLYDPDPTRLHGDVPPIDRRIVVRIEGGSNEGLSKDHLLGRMRIRLTRKFGKKVSSWIDLENGQAEFYSAADTQEPLATNEISKLLFEMLEEIEESMSGEEKDTSNSLNGALDHASGLNQVMSVTARDLERAVRNRLAKTTLNPDQIDSIAQGIVTDVQARQQVDHRRAVQTPRIQRPHVNGRY